MNQSSGRRASHGLIQVTPTTISQQERPTMRTSLAVKIVLPSLFAFALAGNAQQPSATVASVTPQTANGTSNRRDAAKPTIVLVHGAFADATGWQEVIP